MADTTPGEKKLPSLFVRNLARDPESRTMRRLRPGNSLGFLLSDGRRIRRAGGRPTELAQKEVLEHLPQLIEGVTYKYIEITTPEGKVLSVKELAALSDDPEAVQAAVQQDAELRLDTVKHQLQSATPETWDDLHAEFLALAKDTGMDRADAEAAAAAAKEEAATRHSAKTQVIAAEPITPPPVQEPEPPAMVLPTPDFGAPAPDVPAKPDPKPEPPKPQAPQAPKKPLRR